MGIDKLQLVMWCLRKRYKPGQAIPNQDLARAIMLKIGTDPMTISKNRRALKKLGWIRPINRRYFELTDMDIEGTEL